MADWRKVPTSHEVYAVILARHGKELRVFSSYSNPTGHDGLSSQPEMSTEWGFKGDEFPICGARTTWEHGEKEFERVNEQHTYWLCVGELPFED